MNITFIFGNIISAGLSLPLQNPSYCQIHPWVLWKNSRFQELSRMEGENFTRASDSEQQLCAFTMPFSALWQKEEILKAFGLANLGVGNFLLGWLLEEMACTSYSQASMPLSYMQNWRQCINPCR